MSARHQRGLSVLEALFAIAILAVAIAPILAVQAQATREFGRVAEARVQASAEMNALALLREINPMDEPEGARDLGGGQRLTWRATALSSERRSIGSEAPDGAFDVALYRYDATVRDANGRRIAAFSVEQLGWRPTSGR
jgi:general secretion pathway protein I